MLGLYFFKTSMKACLLSTVLSLLGEAYTNREGYNYISPKSENLPHRVYHSMRFFVLVFDRFHKFYTLYHKTKFITLC